MGGWVDNNATLQTFSTKSRFHCLVLIATLTENQASHKNVDENRTNVHNGSSTIYFSVDFLPFQVELFLVWAVGNHPLHLSQV